MVHMRNSHRMFLQAFLTRYILNGKEVKILYKKCCDQFEEDADEMQLGRFVETINTNTKVNNIEIKKAICEDTGSHSYCLVNTADNPLTRLASDYTVNELELFKKLVEQIVQEDGSVASTAVLNLADTLTKKMTKQDAQLLLDRLKRAKWIIIGGGQVSLSPRAITELDTYIQQQYPEQALKCNLCKRLCLKGQSCDVCDVKLHLQCASRLFAQQEEPLCPGEQCTAPWTHTVPRIVKNPSQRSPEKLAASQRSSQVSQPAASTAPSEGSSKQTPRPLRQTRKRTA